MSIANLALTIHLQQQSILLIIIVIDDNEVERKISRHNWFVIYLIMP